jgi:hypothetical protein
MKKYDLIILGLPKTGTTSLFYMLSKHPEICPSKIKEPMSVVEPAVVPHLYFKEFFIGINEDTKVLLDGTPNLFNVEIKQEKLKEILKQKWVNKLKIIYTLRNPIHRMISQMNAMKRETWQVPKSIMWFNEWFDKDKVKEKEALQIISTRFLDSYRLNQVKNFTKYICIIKLSDLDIHSTLNFLGVRDMDLKLNHLKKTDYGKLKNLNLNIDSFVNKNRDYLKTLFTNDIKKIQHNYGIDLKDIINELQEENYSVVSQTQ